MGFNILNVFKKKKKQKNGELVQMVNDITKNTVDSSEKLGEAFKSIATAINTTNISLEIQRLQKLQSRTNKQRSKNKLQKRINALGKLTK
jgi:hypothetical protein